MKQIKVLSTVLLLFIPVVLLFILLHSSYADEDFNKRLQKSTFTSYLEFAKYSCMPCHYKYNTTDLTGVLMEMPENELASYLEEMITEGSMPPDEVIRDILAGKLKYLREHLDSSSPEGKSDIKQTD